MTTEQMQQKERGNKKQLVRSTNHHDKIFKRVFSIPVFAKELILLMFSKKELSCFDLTKLRVEKDTWANKLADLVYSLPLKDHPDKRFVIFIILEHKSKYNPLIWSQLLLYQAGLHDHISKTGWPMPIILGVFYHGKEPWKWPLSFQEGLWGNILKKLGVLAQFMIDYKIKLLSTHDLRLKRAMKDKRLKSRAILNLMSKIWELKDSPEELKKAVALFGELSAEREDVILHVLDYLESMKVITTEGWRDLEKQLVLEGTFKKGGFMDIREEIRQKGRMEGRMEGRTERDREVILNMLKNHLDIPLICKVTGLSQEEIKKLKNGS